MPTEVRERGGKHPVGPIFPYILPKVDPGCKRGNRGNEFGKAARMETKSDSPPEILPAPDPRVEPSTQKNEGGKKVSPSPPADSPDCEEIVEEGKYPNHCPPLSMNLIGR